MRIHIYLKCKYTYENAGFCILCIGDFKILKFFIKLSKFYMIFHREIICKEYIFNFFKGSAF